MLDLLNADRRPGVTADAKGFLDRIDALLPEIRARAAETEQTRAGVGRHDRCADRGRRIPRCSAAPMGRAGTGPCDLLRGHGSIASACGSTGWVASVVGIHPWQIALFANEAQRDVWESDPDARASSSLAPTGSVRRVPWWIPAVRSLAFLQRCRSLRMGAARRYHPG